MNNFTSIASKVNSDPVTLALSLLFGLVPAFLWLRFWLREDREKPEPNGLLFLTFLAGMIAVVLVLPIQRYISTLSNNQDVLTVLWVASEELIKFSAVAVMALHSSYADEPIDFPIYAMTAALGFAALENALFLAYPIGISDTTVSLLTGNLRFLGATLLHSVSSGLIGIMIGLAFFQSKTVKFFSILFGIGLAITLHSIFNFFIMDAGASEVFKIFGFLWVVTIISMLLFEKLRRMSEPLYLKDVVIHGAVNDLLTRR